MKNSFIKTLKLRVWHFLYMPTNVSNVINGKTELARLADRLKEKSDYFLVYQYGKSGSSTVYDYFLRSGFCAIHCHNLNDKTLRMKETLAAQSEMPNKVSGQRFFSNARYRVYQSFLLNNTNSNINIFVSLRKPEGFLLSVYFQQWRLFSSLVTEQYGTLNVENFTEYFNHAVQEIDEVIHASMNQQEIEELILSSQLSFGARNVLHFVYGYMYWFEQELFETFNLNATQLIKQHGFWGFQKNNIKGAIIRVEDFDESLNDSLEFLLDKKIDTPLINKNVAKNKSNVEYYEYLKKNANVSKNIIDVMENSFSYRHFYSDEL